jgi:uroporphyrinogen-III decarboxylase
MVAIGNAVCVPADWFSPADFALAWAEAPDLVVKLVATASERLLSYVERLCAAGVDGFRIVGGEYVTVQLGHKAFAALIEPFDRPLIELMRRHGAIAYYHNHGKVMRFMKELASLGMDALDPLEAAPWGDVTDLADARDLAGNRLCFVGNLDDMEIINALPEDEVAELARERLRQAGPTAFVLGGTASGTYGEQGARGFMAMARMVAGG